MSTPLPADDTRVVLLHNPRCSKSRSTLALLEQHGVQFAARDYLREPLNRTELEELGRRLGLAPSEWIRSGDSGFPAGMDLADSAALLTLLEQQPELLQRPIVVRAAHARIGRPPERVLEILADVLQ